MKKFLEMIEVVRRHGFKVPAHENDVTPRRSNALEDEQFFNFAEQCQPFMFSITGDTPTDIDDKIGEVCDLDAPFAVFSIEMLNGSICVPRSDDIDLGRQIYVECIMACEIKPKEYFYFILADDKFIGSKCVILSTSWDLVVNIFIERINKEKCGFESSRHRIKFGFGKNKRHVTFNRIIHIRPKNYFASETETGESRSINWTYSWLVRGHWRKHEGLGKDRAGSYVVSGFTWVNEHLKGDKLSPLNPKIRLVT